MIYAFAPSYLIKLKRDNCDCLNYLLLRSIDSQILALKDNVGYRKENLELTKKRLESGLISALDLHQAEAAFNNLSAQLSDLIRQREVVSNQLILLSGDMNLNIPENRIDKLLYQCIKNSIKGEKTCILLNQKQYGAF